MIPKTALTREHALLLALCVFISAAFTFTTFGLIDEVSAYSAKRTAAARFGDAPATDETEKTARIAAAQSALAAVRAELESLRATALPSENAAFQQFRLHLTELATVSGLLITSEDVLREDFAPSAGSTTAGPVHDRRRAGRPVAPEESIAFLKNAPIKNSFSLIRIGAKGTFAGIESFVNELIFLNPFAVPVRFDIVKSNRGSTKRFVDIFEEPALDAELVIAIFHGRGK